MVKMEVQQQEFLSHLDKNTLGSPPYVGILQDYFAATIKSTMSFERYPKEKLLEGVLVDIMTKKNIAMFKDSFQVTGSIVGLKLPWKQRGYSQEDFTKLLLDLLDQQNRRTGRQGAREKKEKATAMEKIISHKIQQDDRIIYAGERDIIVKAFKGLFNNQDNSIPASDLEEKYEILVKKLIKLGNLGCIIYRSVGAYGVNKKHIGPTHVSMIPSFEENPWNDIRKYIKNTGESPKNTELFIKFKSLLSLFEEGQKIPRGY